MLPEKHSDIPIVLARLHEDGLIRREGDGYCTTRQWRAAMVRAALCLYDSGDRDLHDLRLCVTHALLEHYGLELTDQQVLLLVEVMLPIEVADVYPGGPGQQFAQH